jgi:hypothetical protein
MDSSPCDNCLVLPLCLSKKGHVILEECELTRDYIVSLFKPKLKMEYVSDKEIKFPIKEFQKEYSLSVWQNDINIIIYCYNEAERWPTYNTEKVELWKERHFIYIPK